MVFVGILRGPEIAPILEAGRARLVARDLRDDLRRNANGFKSSFGENFTARFDDRSRIDVVVSVNILRATTARVLTNRERFVANAQDRTDVVEKT